MVLARRGRGAVAAGTHDHRSCRDDRAANCGSARSRLELPVISVRIDRPRKNNQHRSPCRSAQTNRHRPRRHPHLRTSEPPSVSSGAPSEPPSDRRAHRRSSRRMHRQACRTPSVDRAVAETRRRASSRHRRAHQTPAARRTVTRAGRRARGLSHRARRALQRQRSRRRARGVGRATSRSSRRAGSRPRRATTVPSCS